MDGDPISKTLQVFAQSVSSAEGWSLNTSDDGRLQWSEFHKQKVRPRTQGWKLHVSATVHSAGSILQVVLPVLMDFGVSFKIPSSIRDLVFLNSGKAGLTQVGKFITIYPDNDEQLVRLAQQLDKLTTGLSGPMVLSDRPLRPGGIVHYRYGSFTSLKYQNQMGQVVAAIQNAKGEFEEDIREDFIPPDWVVDPFEAQQLLPQVRPQNPLLNNRYLVFGSLYQSAKGNVYLALDVESDEVKNCVVKEARREIYLDAGRVDAIAMLNTERHVLEQLAPHCFTPKVFDYFERDGDAYLVLEYLEGTALRSYVTSRACRGLYLSEKQIVEFGSRLCAILQVLHDSGIVHRDLKPGNILIDEDLNIKLIDFELAYDQKRSPSDYPILGTRGYYSPQQIAGDEPAQHDDIFGLGSVLYFLATNSDPSLAPREWVYEDRPIEKLNPRISPELRSAIVKSMAPDAGKRYFSINEVREALAAIPAKLASSAPVALAVDTDREPSVFLELAVGVAMHLCRLTESTEQGLSWISMHPQSYGARQRDIQAGASGIGMVLMDVYRYDQSKIFRDTAEQACAWLESINYERDDFLPGLYVGECGFGLLSLMLSKSLDNEKHLENSRRVATAVDARLPNSPDLFNGLAGCGLYFLILYDATGDNSYLQRATVIGDRLIAAASCADHSCNWVIPPGYGPLSGEEFLGFAHGAAGIGYFLLELYEATRQEKFREFADKAANYIMAQGERALDDGSGINWPDTDSAAVQSLYWCHGASGIARFLLRSSEVCENKVHMELAKRAGLLVAHASGWLNPTQCHGLSGNIECLLDLYQATADEVWLNHALNLAELLMTQAIEQAGSTVWPSEEPTILTPEFMVGQSGVAACLVRLYDFQHHPHLFTRKFFKEALLKNSPALS